MNAIDLIRAQMALECKAVNAAGELVRIPGSNPDTIPRLYVAQHDAGYVAYPRHDLPATIRQKLHALPPQAAFHDREAVRAILQEEAPCEDIELGKSYVFPSTISPHDHSDVVRLTERHRAMIAAHDARIDLSRGGVYAIIRDGRIVSTCESSRENETAGEAWVRTLTEHRRRGYARQVTAAWAHGLQRHSKIPFYSHRRDNLASQAVANSLQLIQYQAYVAYS